jgi:hypothetical protein
MQFVHPFGGGRLVVGRWCFIRARPESCEWIP